MTALDHQEVRQGEGRQFFIDQIELGKSLTHRHTFQGKQIPSW